MNVDLSEIDIEEALLILSCYSACSIWYMGDKESVLKEVELEYIQYTLLSISNSSTSPKPVQEKLLTHLIDQAKEATSGFIEHCWQTNSTRYSSDILGGVIQAQLTSILYRNTMYLNDFIEITTEMLEPISEEIEKKSGVNISLLLRLVKFFIEKVVPGGIELVLDPTSNSDDANLLQDMLTEPNRSRIKKHYSLDIKELAEQLCATSDELLQLLDLVSHRPGELDTSIVGSKSFFEQLPLRFKPFVVFQNSRVSLPSGTLLNTYFFDMVFSLVYQHKSAKECFERRRANYVEEKVYSLFKERFPFAEVYRGVYLDHFGKDEKDIVIKCGDTLLLIEAKSNKVNKNIFKGRDFALRENLLSTIVKANNQAAQFKEQFIDSNLVRIGKTKKTDFVLDPRRLTNVKQIVVILNEFGGLHTNYRNYSDLVPESQLDSLVITLSDLMVVFEILQSPSEVMDYIFQRVEFEKGVNFKGDEMDLLSYYLMNRFDVNFEKYKGAIALFKGISEKVDIYKNQSHWGVSPMKPKCEITPFWSQLIHTLEQRLKENSLAITRELYRANLEDQKYYLEVLTEKLEEVEKSRDRNAFSTLSIEIVSKNILIQFVLIKYPNVHLFPHLLKVVEGEMSGYSDKHMIFFNVGDNLNYAGYVLRKKSPNKVGNALVKWL